MTGTWAAELQALREAEACGDRVQAAALRLRLLRLREQDRGPQDYGAMDLALLDSLGADLRSLGWWREALAAHQAAYDMARSLPRGYPAVHFGCRLAHSHLDALDFTSAEEILTEVLLEQRGKLDPSSGALEEACATARDIDTALEPEARYAIGRLWAALGHLGAARGVLGPAVEWIARNDHAALSAPELAIFMAELCLDRGDFGEADALAERWELTAPEPALRAKWRVLRATLDAMTGHLSDAEQRLAALLTEPSESVPPKVRRAARWRRLHALVALNRSAEAQALLAEHAADQDVGKEDLRSVWRLLHARQMLLPETAKEFLEGSSKVLLDGGGLDLAADGAPACDASGDPRRASERFFDDWSRLSGRCLAALDAWDLDAASADLLHLTRWSAALDSPLVAARLAHLQALSAYYSRADDDAAVLSEMALKGYHALDMVGDVWAVGQLQGWLLQRFKAPQAAQLDLAQEQHQRLAVLVERLSSERDRVYFLLNKWTFTDFQIVRRCERRRQLLGRLSSLSPRLGRWVAPREAQRTLRLLLDLRRAEWNHPPAEKAPPGSARTDPYEEQLRWSVREADRHCGHEPGWLGKRAALLCYFVLPDRIVLGAAHRKGAIVLEHGLARGALWQSVQRALEELWYAGPSLSQKAQRVLRVLSEALCLEEALAWLPDDVEELYVVPDDVLFQVPFAALPVADVPLLRRAALAVLPSLAFTKSAPQLRTACSLGVAVPASPAAGDAYDELPSAERELSALGTLEGAARCLVGEAATRRGVLSQLPTASMVHFACHGDFHPDEPHRSGLLLQDGWLSIRDLRGMDLSSLSLATLGACWSGNLAVLPGRALVGLPAALLGQGVQAVLSPLFRVVDESSAAFAAALYPSLREHGLVHGLGRVQRAFMERESPRVWAAYTLYLRGLSAPWPARWLLSLRAALSLRGGPLLPPGPSDRGGLAAP